MKIDLRKVEELITSSPTWLEAMEIRKQCGISATTFGERLARLVDVPDPLDDVDAMEVLGIALWLIARREHGDHLAYQQFMADLTLQDFADAAEALPAPEPANRAARRAKPPKRARAS